MSKRRITAVVGLALALGVLAVALDPTRILWGLLHRESFYAGRPTSYWSQRAIPPAHRSSVMWEVFPDFPLYNNPNPDAIPVLVELLADANSLVRRLALNCLGRLGPAAQSAVPAMIDTLRGDNEDSVRARAAVALAEVGSADRVTTALEEALVDPAPRVRRDAAVALWKVTGRTDAAVPVLVDMLQRNDFDTEHAASGLSQMGPAAAAAVPALVARLRDRTPPGTGGYSDRLDIFHRAILEAIGDIGPAAKDARGAVSEALGAPNAFVRASAAVTLWKITGDAEPGVTALVGVLNDPGDAPNDIDRRWAMDGLGRMGPAAKATVPALRKQFKGPDEMVRQDAAAALKKIDPETATKDGVK